MSNPAALILCNEALIALGEQPLDDMEGDSAANAVATLRYQSVIDTLLGSHPWVFNRQLATLSRLLSAAPDATGFSAAYQLPALCFRIVAPYVDAVAATEWSIASGLIFLDASADQAVTLEYHTRATEALWRPGFRQAAVYRLAAEFCIPLTDDPARAKLLHGLADAELARARHLNATEHPAMRLGNVGRGRIMRSRFA